MKQLRAYTALLALAAVALGAPMLAGQCVFEQHKLTGVGGIEMEDVTPSMVADDIDAYLRGELDV